MVNQKNSLSFLSCFLDDPKLDEPIYGHNKLNKPERRK